MRRGSATDGRLRRLGEKLALINMGISGAILIVIAWVALTIADRTIEQQGSRDLSLYMRAVHTLVARSREDLLSEGVTVDGALLQLPERYQVYFYAYNVNEEPNASAEPVEARRLTEVPGVSLTADEAYGLVDGADVKPMESRWAGGYTTTATMRGEGYRISVANVEQSDGTLLVVQNLSDEMALRGRMRLLLTVLTLFGMGLIVFVSLRASRQSIKPIEESIQKQRQFVAAASHELRTPVTALCANAEVLTDAPLGEYAPYLDSIRSVSERMTRLIQDLIDLARADAGELPIDMTPVEASEAASDALLWMRPLAAKREICVVAELETAYITGDAGRLRQVLVALMDNALRYTPAGGVITLAVKREARHVKLVVADTGMGIPDASKQRVFDRFFRTDEARDRENGGAGLGLSVVKQLTEGMRGTVNISDNPRGGTIFTLRFKLAE